MHSPLTLEKMSIELINVSDEEHYERDELLEAIYSFGAEPRRCRLTGHVFLIDVREEVTL